MRVVLPFTLVAALILGCGGDPEGCEYPPVQGAAEPCCTGHGIDACAGGLFCAALDGRTIASCSFEGSRADGQTCTGDVQCASMSCNTTAGACRSLGVNCEPDIGCAPLAGARRACGLVSGVRVCVNVGDGSSGAACGDDTDCDAGLRCDATEAICANCTREMVPAPVELDLLFVIDNSNSMAEEQATLSTELPRIMRILASGDRDGDGAPDFTPPLSVHVGIITTDMGSADADVPTCDTGTFGARRGDDGVLITRGRTAIAGCMPAYPAVFELAAGDDPADFATDLACVAHMGTGGCGWEQQLEATLKALSPSSPQPWTIPDYAPPVFFDGAMGHGANANGGFLRNDSVLAVVVLTDEEDCSVQNPDVLDPGSAAYRGTDLNLRCFVYPETIHPIERYVRGADGRSGLLGLRRRPDQLIFSVIAGVPGDAIEDPGAPDYTRILSHPEMQERVDPAAPTRLAPSCNTPGRGYAFPPRRIVQVAQQLSAAGARVSVGSICEESYARPFDALLASLTQLPGCR